MKIIITFLAYLFISQNGFAQNKIKIFHRGINDKPFPTIIVNEASEELKTDSSAFFTRVFVYSKENYAVFKEIVLNKLKKYNDRGECSYGCFRVEIHEGDREYFYVLKGRSYSKKYFQILIQNLSNYKVFEDVKETVEDILQRINY